ncbi:MAG: type II toxin-antitoxin system RelE/ParE family toxin [Bdellovibrio sp.]|nr:type II toxin-antitoxin system RelE/ParE family toxin [Bdellovibrio sp.]
MEVHVKKLQKYVTDNGRCPFDEWIESLSNRRVQAIVATRLNRVIQGNYGHCRKLEGGILELKIDFGAGLRIYFAEEGNTIVVLLCGGDKSTQSKDILKAQEYWAEYNKE